MAGVALSQSRIGVVQFRGADLSGRTLGADTIGYSWLGIQDADLTGAGTELRRLDPEKLASWLDNYRLGDLWRMGELGANP